MIKKIVKYGKILMALTLIGALSIPSYATVGASDGSAFVTKAEFDAALSDFNARLTTFEAGINSKIDSQVSSYLDRNGIWNKQTQSFSGIHYLQGENSGLLNSSATMLSNGHPKINLGGKAANNCFGDSNDEKFPHVVFCDVQKSGMAVAGAIFYYDLDGPAYNTSNEWPVMIWYYYSTATNATYTAWDNKQCVFDHWGTGGPTTSFRMFHNFFVKKGDKLAIRLALYQTNSPSLCYVCNTYCEVFSVDVY